MTKRQKILNSMIDATEPAWKSSVFSKIVFRKATRLATYFGVMQLIAFCDALSIFFVTIIDKFVHYFDLSRKFDR